MQHNPSDGADIFYLSCTEAGELAFAVSSVW